MQDVHTAKVPGEPQGAIIQTTLKHIISVVIDYQGITVNKLCTFRVARWNEYSKIVKRYSMQLISSATAIQSTSAVLFTSKVYRSTALFIRLKWHTAAEPQTSVQFSSSGKTKSISETTYIHQTNRMISSQHPSSQKLSMQANATSFLYQTLFKVVTSYFLFV